MSSAGQITALNTFGASGLVSRSSGRASTFYAFDERGSVAQRTSSTGAVTSSDLYDGFGKLLAGGAAGDPWGYGAQWGYYTDTETGLILCTHRFYDPQQERFLTRDSMGYDGGINLYGYTGNDSINFIDPLGYDAWTLGLRLAGGAEILGGGPEDPVADIAAGVILGVAGGIYLANKFPQENDPPWMNDPDPETNPLRGKNPGELGNEVPPEWGPEQPTRDGGKQWRAPGRGGDGLRQSPGHPENTDPDVPDVKRGPYCRVNKGGIRSEPIPLEGNPTL